MSRFEDTMAQRMDESSSLPHGDDASSTADDSQEQISNGNEDDDFENEFGEDSAVNMSARGSRDSSPPPGAYQKYTAAMLAGQ